MDAKTIESNLQGYYTGLVNAGGRNVPKGKVISVVALFKETKTFKGDVKTFAGTITMLDYMAQKPITLNCKIHLTTCAGENKTFIFYELSPKALSHKTWKELDKLWTDFNCKKS